MFSTFFLSLSYNHRASTWMNNEKWKIKIAKCTTRQLHIMWFKARKQNNTRLYAKERNRRKERVNWSLFKKFARLFQLFEGMMPRKCIERHWSVSSPRGTRRLCQCGVRSAVILSKQPSEIPCLYSQGRGVIATLAELWLVRYAALFIRVDFCTLTINIRYIVLYWYGDDEAKKKKKKKIKAK